MGSDGYHRSSKVVGSFRAPLVQIKGKNSGDNLRQPMVLIPRLAVGTGEGPVMDLSRKSFKIWPQVGAAPGRTLNLDLVDFS